MNIIICTVLQIVKWWVIYFTFTFKAVFILFCCIDLFYSGLKDCISRLLIYLLFIFVECKMDVLLEPCSLGLPRELKNSLSNVRAVLFYFAKCNKKKPGIIELNSRDNADIFSNKVKITFTGFWNNGQLIRRIFIRFLKK